MEGNSISSTVDVYTQRSTGNVLRGERTGQAGANTQDSSEVRTGTLREAQASNCSRKDWNSRAQEQAQR